MYDLQHSRIEFTDTRLCQQVIDSGGSNQYAVRYCHNTPARQCGGCGIVRCREHYFDSAVVSLAGQCSGCCASYTGD